MATQTLMWTALPNGFDENGDLRVSALLSPRLEPDADQILKRFDDFLDWPATLKQSRFTIRWGAAEFSIHGDETDRTIDLPDSDTWQALFPPETFVRGRKFEDLSANVVLSYDTAAVDGLLQSMYGSLGRKAGENLPKLSEILAEEPWSRAVRATAVLDRFSSEGRIPTGGKASVPNYAPLFQKYVQDRLDVGDSTTQLLATAQLFHTPPSTVEVQDYSGSTVMAADDPRRDAAWRSHRSIARPDPDTFRKKIDFHQIVSAMNQYPRLLRRLGLVVDFVIPAATFPAGPPAGIVQPLTVRCDLGTPNVAGVTRQSVPPKTQTLRSPREFRAANRPTFHLGDFIVRNGLMTINRDLFSLLQNDVDAGLLKMMNFARTLSTLMSGNDRHLDPVSRFERDAGAPALRTAGLMLVQRRRGVGLESAIDNGKAQEAAFQKALATKNDSFAPDFYLEDLLRGWRIDIWDDRTGRWHSLCERAAKYNIADGAVVLDDDSEGIVRLAATKSSDPASNQNLIWLHEALVSWTGWSLVARRPGRVVDRLEETKFTDGQAEVPPGLRLSTDFQVRPGTLPRLRYGRRYWIRARAVDLAANSLPPKPEDIAAEHPKDSAEMFRRFEPVQPPALALRREGTDIEKPLEGESMDRIAIRSFNETPPDNLVPTTATAHRRAVPDRSDIRTAELHGKLDDGLGGTVNSSAEMFTLLAEKDKQLEEVRLETPGPLTTSTVETSYAVLDNAVIDIPYLPDPLCREVAARIFNHPTFPASKVIRIPVYGADDKWPQARPFTIRVIEDPAKLPAFDEDTRILEIPLPKAIRATLRLSATLSTGVLDQLGIWNWIPQADRTPALTKRAVDGQHWMLTPWREVDLVHAVQKPLIAPELKLSVARGWKDTNATPLFSATCSIKSTARVDLQAEWNDPGPDSEPADSSANIARSDHAFSVKITDPLTYATPMVTPGATGAPEHVLAGPDMISVGVYHDTTVKRHEFGDTRYRRIEYWLDATTRFREFMPPAVLSDDKNITVTGPRFVSWIPSSAPPPAPDVLAVVPTFGWNRSGSTASSRSSTRHGGGLRIYLNRPWNRTGYGEMLAVVLPRAGFAGDPNKLPSNRPYKKFVTQWGNDPIWKSSFVAGPSPTASAFSFARTAPDPTGKWLPDFAPSTEADQPHGPFRTTSLTHPGLGVSSSDSESFVDIAPHDVFWDAERHLWYCDIDLNFGASYFPFVRLALARYQPGSIDGAHLSDIVLADIASLAPDRWMTLTAGVAARTWRASLYGWSPEESSAHMEGQRSRPPLNAAAGTVVDVWVERFNPDYGEDFGWSRDLKAKITPGPEPTVPPLPPASTRPGPRLSPLERVSTSAAGSVFTRVPNIRDIVIQPLTPQLWTGKVELPTDAPAGTRFRLVVAEYEEYIVDDATPYDSNTTAKDRRLVFVEHVELTA